MAGDETTVEQAADELYALPAGEFTAARDERAKALRKSGDREGADAVKALRKPTVAAWALNQLARARGKDVERLVKAGERLRAAQEELLAGGDRSAFQEAAGEERELVAELAGAATALASEAGERGTGLPEKLAATLHAAALDEDVAEQLRAGRLAREQEAIGGFGGAGFGAATAGSAPAKTQLRNRAAPRKAASSAKKSAKARGADPKRAKAADDAARRQALAAARSDERHARKQLEAAEKALEHAESRAEAAKAHAAEAAERAKVTADRLKEAKRAHTAARKVHARAERALESAEGAR